jgi:two-component system, NtrC family, nitrogen regulation sensor histidine kinase NtrY
MSPNNPTPRRRRASPWMILGGVFVVLLAAALFTLGSLRIPIHPEEPSSLVLLFALSAFAFLAFVVFSLILLRSLLRMAADRRAGTLGSRFRTKMVLGAMGISLLPLAFLFLFSYSLVNRTLNLWFPKPLEIATEESGKLIDDMSGQLHARLVERAARAARQLPDSDLQSILSTSAAGPSSILGNAPDALWIADPNGSITQAAPLPILIAHLHKAEVMPSGAEIWQTDSASYMVGSAPVDSGSLYVARRLRPDFLQNYNSIQSELHTYQQQRQNIRVYKRDILLALSLVTLLLLFSTTWVAFYLSKQVTVPIQAMAEATEEVAHGNFDHRITVAHGEDELGKLITSFNAMTAQLGEGRRQINEFTRNLEQAFEDRERRRKLMETILENIPTGVVSLDADGEISRANSALLNIFGERARSAHTLNDLLGEEASRPITALMRRSLRMGIASREIEFAVPGRLIRAAVTVSSLGPRTSNPGFVIVFDDLSELLRAQKAAAWQEVAQRIAHEIKNPLTPIILSAERLQRYLERSAHDSATAARYNNDSQPATPELKLLIAECADLIHREARTLESLVSEFWQFARFPAARLAPCNLNDVVIEALALFRDRLEGVHVHTDLARNLPPIKADAELLRRVLANLIDNAAEAMEGATVRDLTISTNMYKHGDAVQVEIADTGHGISPEDKERLFFPHFSTKERGTGLGLAISSRIVAEHNGTIRIDDNKPVGARFTIRIPVAEPVTASAPASNLSSSGNGQAQAQTQTPTAAAASPSEAAAQPHKST